MRVVYQELMARALIRYLAFIVCVILLGLVLGCETVPKAQTVPERLAVGYATVTLLRQETTRLLEARSIGVIDARRVLELTDLARSTLDRSRDLHFKGANSEAEKALELANGVLLDLQKYLNLSQGRKVS